LEPSHYPLLRGGVAAPIKQSNVTLDSARPGEVKRLLQKGSDLPRCALYKVARHFVYRAQRPLLEGGDNTWFQFFHAFLAREVSL